MKLHIAKDRLIKEVQDDFNSMYPFLKIEFFTKEHGYRQASPARLLIPAHKKLCDASKTSIDKSELSIKDDMTVSELEHRMREDYGLNIQVFRKSGNLWLETTMTDNWTLKQQNDHGTEISGSYSSPKKEYPGGSIY